MEKISIGIYGRTNSGKSSLINFITGQRVSITSSQAGTTTDPVRRSFEILDFAPVVFIDTAGLDDITTELGCDRVEKSLQTIMNIELALIVTDGRWGECEQEFVSLLEANDIPSLVIFNDFSGCTVQFPSQYDYFRTTLQGSPDKLLEAVKAKIPNLNQQPRPFFGDRLSEGDTVLLICPIDSEAPTGRLILPQVQALRGALDAKAMAVTIQPEQISMALATTHPRLIVTDSQLFGEISPMIPEGIPLTSFSILLSELKGDPKVYGQGLEAIDHLRDGDQILIVESCSHQSSCEDIGRIKIPRWLEQYSGARLDCRVIGGLEPLPRDLSRYSLIIQCGGCMATRRAVQSRIRAAVRAGVPITNYGLAIRKLTRT